MMMLPTFLALTAALQIPVGDKVLLPLTENVYVEPGLTARELEELRQAHRSALAGIQRTFGQLQGKTPLTLFCHSAKCKVALGAPSEVAASTELGFARDGVQTDSGFVKTNVLVVSGPYESTARVTFHEMVHAEMKSYVPYDALPTWFNEGVATFFADEPGCSAHPPASVFDVRALDSKQKWQEFIRAPGATQAAYCQSRHEISTWAETRGGRLESGKALRALLQNVARGESFDRAIAR